MKLPKVWFHNYSPHLTTMLFSYKHEKPKYATALYSTGREFTHRYDYNHKHVCIFSIYYNMK